MPVVIFWLGTVNVSSCVKHFFSKDIKLFNFLFVHYKKTKMSLLFLLCSLSPPVGGFAPFNMRILNVSRGLSGSQGAPGGLRELLGASGGSWGPKEAPGSLRGPLGAWGDPWGPQGAPRGPRGSQGAPGPQKHPRCLREGSWEPSGPRVCRFFMRCYEDVSYRVFSHVYYFVCCLIYCYIAVVFCFDFIRVHPWEASG